MTVTDLAGAAASTEAAPGPGRITVRAEELLAALDTVEPHSGGQHPVLAGIWMLIEPHRLRLTASDRYTIATTLTRGTDSAGTWSGRIAPGRIGQLHSCLSKLPDYEFSAPITLTGQGEQLNITSPEETLQIPTTTVAPPAAVHTALAAATTPVAIPALGMHIGPQLLARFAAMAGPEPVYLRLAHNPSAAHSTRSAYMLVLASRTALGLAPMHTDDRSAEDVAELWAELHHTAQTAPTVPPEQACPEHFAGALVCTLAAGHDGKHRHTTGRTWWWDD